MSDRSQAISDPLMQSADPFARLWAPANPLMRLGSCESDGADPQWPVLHEDAMCGLAGDVVRKLEPHTEADPVALLLQVLSAFGNAAGRSAYFEAGGSRHYGNLFAVMVGKTSKARKGTSWAAVHHAFSGIDPNWLKERMWFPFLGGMGRYSCPCACFVPGTILPKSISFVSFVYCVASASRKRGRSLSQM